jgi:hypothetical protein
MSDGRRWTDILARTFLKRKGGLFKKAHELSVLCSVDVAVIIFGHNKKLYEFSSGDINETLRRYNYVRTLTLLCWATLTICSMDNLTNTKGPPTSRTREAMTMTMKTRTTMDRISKKTRYRRHNTQACPLMCSITLHSSI